MVSEPYESDDGQKTPAIRRWNLSPLAIGTLMTVLALIVPMEIQLDYGGSVTLIALTYVWQLNYGHIALAPDPFAFSFMLLFGGLRLVFAMMMYRLYNGDTTKWRTIIIGILGEIQLVAIMYSGPLFILLRNNYADVIFPPAGPFPILLIITLILFILIPPPTRADLEVSRKE